MCDQQSLRSACAYAQSDQSLCLSLKYSMKVKLLTEHHLEFLSLKVGCTGLSEPTLVKMPHCWKSHVTAPLSILALVAILFHGAKQFGIFVCVIILNFDQWFRGRSVSYKIFLIYISGGHLFGVAKPLKQLW